MSNEQFINNLVRYDCFGVLNNTAKDYNEAVTRLALNDENTFTEELLIAMVRNQWINSATQKAAVAFCYEKILEKQQTNYVPQLTYEITYYVPEFRRELDKAWAIDSSGEAYFYEDNEDMECGSQQWGSDSFYHKDYNFDKVKYEHMWKGVAWTNSKIVKESKDYNPVYPEGKTAWAIDHDGDAFYYNESPRRCTYAWTSNKGYTVDSNFDSNKYKHMWADGAWRNSLKSK